MPFTKTTSKTPTTIGRIDVRLVDQDGQNVNRVISGKAQVLDQNGEILAEWNGDLLPQLTQAQTNTLISFLDSLRAKAVAELL